MSTNGFREEELVTRRMNGQTRVFPIVGGRLRLAHEGNQTLNLETNMVQWDGEYAVFRCRAVTEKGQFVGYGTANAQRDARLAESLIELAETRSIARALRFAGYGVEYTGLEEVSHVGNSEPAEGPPPQGNGGNGGGNGRGRSESTPQHCGNGGATGAQVRALHALTKKAKYTEEDLQSLLRPLQADSFKDLDRQAASQLITYLQTEVGQ